MSAEELDNYEAEVELSLYREYRDVVSVNMHHGPGHSLVLDDGKESFARGRAELFGVRQLVELRDDFVREDAGGNSNRPAAGSAPCLINAGDRTQTCLAQRHLVGALLFKTPHFECQGHRPGEHAE